MHCPFHLPKHELSIHGRCVGKNAWLQCGSERSMVWKKVEEKKGSVGHYKVSEEVPSSIYQNSTRHLTNS